MSSCEDCKFCLFEDYGYSNYTTEGTEFICLKKLHPDGSFDRFYGEDKRLNFASKCSSFTEGQPVEVDCDREDLKNYNDSLSSVYTADPEIKALLDQYEERERR
ncbi:hypothetical protein LCGC14_0610280 [marine sediment metagenome]|uniref:Uncharacterized protein n=1 Tax=marine sediment metagenome TaxID=412755 RepID=A0A0F9RCG0_9ZZZZ